MANVPCINPKLCKVKSHLPGTNPLCRQPKVARTPGRAGALNPNPLLATGPSKKEIDSDTRKRLSDQNKLLSMSSKSFVADTRAASNFEQILKMTSDLRLIALASEYSDFNTGVKYDDLAADVNALGYGSPEDKAYYGVTDQAIQALQIIHDSDDPKVVESIKSRRVVDLSRDPYVREYSDERHDAVQYRNFGLLKIADNKLHNRLRDIGLTDVEVAELKGDVSMQVQQNYHDSMNVTAQWSPDGVSPPWKPFKVDPSIVSLPPLV